MRFRVPILDNLFSIYSPPVFNHLDDSQSLIQQPITVFSESCDNSRIDSVDVY